MNILKYIFELLFRLIPFPVKPKLIKVGNPDPSSPVLVTTNYDLTVRRVRKALKDFDCYLLVAPAKGINVWCGAGGGHFNADSIVSIIKTSKIEDLVDLRKLIIPQLCANGILIKDIKEKTGWDATFGPAHIRDLPRFVSNKYKKTSDMNVVKFDFGQRLEMGLAMAANFLFVLAIILVILARNILLPALIISFLLCMVVSLGAFMIPGRSWLRKGLIVGLISSGIFLVYSLVVGDYSVGTSIRSVLGIFALSIAVELDLPAWTPLWRCNLTGGSRSKVELYVDKDRCIGCTLCWQVCPTGVFEVKGDKSEAVYVERCETCTACVKQCPTGAVVTDMKVNPSCCACPTCKVIETVSKRNRVS